MTLAALVTAILLHVAGHTVQVTCNPGLPQAGTTTFPGGAIALNAGLCRSLETLIRDPAGLKLHYAHPYARDFWQAAALLTVLHEAEHVHQHDIGQGDDEHDAQCVAMTKLDYWLRVLRVPAARRQELELVAVKVTASMPPAYRVACGGPSVVVG
jgi:hypothetical protein